MISGVMTLDVGNRLRAITRRITPERIRDFQMVGQLARLGPDSEHHTPDAKSGQGFAPGQLAFAYLHELVAAHFGKDFRQGGRLALTFLKPLYAGDAVTAGGVVTGKTIVQNRATFVLDVWLVNQAGERMAEGQAQVTVPSPLT